MKKETRSTSTLLKVLVLLAGAAGVGVGIHAANTAWQKNQERKWLETESRHCRIERR